MIKALTVRPDDADIPYGVLSGGNKQKVIFARALLNRPNLYILCEPTRGVDIQTRAEIYRTIRRMPSADCAVLVLSSDAEDLFAVCDQIGLIRDGVVDDLRPTSELTIEDLEEMV
jgi:ribose transport system ATP-binding protein